MGHSTLSLDLGKIADPLDQPVDNARGPAGPAGNLGPALLVYGNSQQACRTHDDSVQLGRGVKVQAIDQAKPFTKRGREGPGTGRGPDQGKARQVQLDRARRGPLPDYQIQLEILHRRVQRLFDGSREPMDFINKQHVAVLEIRQDRGQITRMGQHQS